MDYITTQSHSYIAINNFGLDENVLPISLLKELEIAKKSGEFPVNLYPAICGIYKKFSSDADKINTMNITHVLDSTNVFNQDLVRRRIGELFEKCGIDSIVIKIYCETTTKLNGRVVNCESFLKPIFKKLFENEKVVDIVSFFFSARNGKQLCHGISGEFYQDLSFLDGSESEFKLTYLEQ